MTGSRLKTAGGILAAAASILLAQAAFATRALAQDQTGTHPVAMDSVSAREVKARLNLHDIGTGETLHLTVGHSTVLQGVSPMKRVYIGNPAVLQSFTAGPSELVLTAKTSGVSSLVIWDTVGKSCLYTVAVDLDSESLRHALQESYPHYAIQAEGREGRIYLTGTVATQEMSDGAAKLAASYSKDVVNSLRVVPERGKQVQLKLRIVEVDRTKMEQYGISIAGGGKNPFAISTQQYSAPTPVSGIVNYTDPLNLLLFSSKLNVGATVKDLEQKQILQVLAEPTLTAMSGQSAKFLSGGEFPYPVVQGTGTGTGSAAITIMFRPYGVKVDFTPVVNDDGSIRLKVSPEVSTLDFSNAVTISGFTVPALSTRRAETEIEIKSGQSFAVSGLLDHRTTESLSQMPGISNIPILGKLFISKSYTRSVVELVVFVTASVVDPLTDNLAVPDPVAPTPYLNNEEFDQHLSKEQKLPARTQ